jgi:uncharacterized protein involved in outer membrane biogenesis
VTRGRKVLLAVLALIALFLILFDWNWLRGPVQRYVSEKTQREFRISHLAVSLGRYPKVTLKDVFFANADWSKQGPMAQVGKLEFTVSLRDLFEKKIVLPKLALSQADITMEELKDGRRNWIFSDPNDTSDTVFRISTLSVDQGKLHYINHGEVFDLTILASTFDPASTAKVTDASVRGASAHFTTKYTFKGKYRDAGFTGDALTGDVLSFQESNTQFPFKGGVKADTTHLEMEGTVADVVKISAADVNIRIAGQTMANLYPFLLLPLPASPPYDLRGRLKFSGNKYTMDNLAGKIGSTDIHGEGAYLRREPRPLLTAHLRSKNLNLADLGPLVGLKTKDTAPGEKPTQAELSSRPVAQAKEQQSGGDRILPTGTFEATRLRIIDADVTLDAAKLVAPSALALETLRADLHLKDSVLTLTPLEFGFAGGRIISRVSLDARQTMLRSTADVDFRHVQVDKLFPNLPKIAKGTGLIGAQIHLAGQGNSIADILANSNGTAGVAIADGEISNLLDAASGLNGGKVLALLVGGDKTIPIRCGAVTFEVKDGIGTSNMFVLDTAQTRVDGNATLNLKDEKFDMIIAPKPKKPGILSLRTPFRVHGTFRDAQFEVDKKAIALRAGAAAVLAAVSPVAILLPLLEPGPGKDTDCAAVLAPVRGAQQQADTDSRATPKIVAKVPAGKAVAKAPAAKGAAPAVKGTVETPAATSAAPAAAAKPAPSEPVKPAEAPAGKLAAQTR